MSENESATPAPEAEPQQEATPQAQAEPAKTTPEPKAQPDWEAAYKGLQTSLNKAHSRNEELLQQNAALATGLSALRSGQQEIVKATLGEDKAREMAARDAQTIAQEAARRAATAANALMASQANVILGTLAAAGIDPRDPSIDWANDASSVQEWEARVLPSVQARIQKATEERIAKERATFQAKTAAEVRAEAEALNQRQQKAEEKIDTARGTASTSMIDRIRQAQRDPELMARMLDNAKSGRPI